jgi:murein DD-endopeptidase MepM/ murein hydrolase activator NlpD
MSSLKFWAKRKQAIRRWRLLFAVTTFLLAGCSSPLLEPIPNRINQADPVILPSTTNGPPPIGPDLAKIETALPTTVNTIAAPSLGHQTETPIPPLPLSGSGIRPNQALLYRPPELGPSSPVDWRPPPVSVPHSLHPDDHYWLARPLSSNTRNYDLEWYPYGNEPTLAAALPYRVHHGMDFPNDPGTPVFATSSGTVVHAGPLPSHRNGVNYYGNTVIIHHDWQWMDKDIFTLYAHTLELFVTVGEYVERGQLIAGVGASGGVSGPHLHLEVRVGDNNYANTRNPAFWLAPYEGWGTLAGRFVDIRGRMIHGGLITVRPLRVESEIDIPVRRQLTYAKNGPVSDEIWRENFVVADLPAGQYTLLLSTAGETFRRTVDVLPGQTNFVVVQADFEFVPTVTPTSTPVPSPTSPIVGTITATAHSAASN